MNLSTLFAVYVFTALAAALAQYADNSRTILACGLELGSGEAMAMRVVAASTWPARAVGSLWSRASGRRSDDFLFKGETLSELLGDVADAGRDVVSEHPVAQSLSPLAQEANGVIFPKSLRTPIEAHTMK